MNSFTVLGVFSDVHVSDAYLGELSKRFTVLNAATMVEALDLFERKRPHAVVTAMEITGGDGRKLCELLREHEGDSPRRALMLLVGYDEEQTPPERKKRQQEWGIDAILPSSAPPDVVVSTLFLQLRGQARAAAHRGEAAGEAGKAAGHAGKVAGHFGESPLEKVKHTVFKLREALGWADSKDGAGARPVSGKDSSEHDEQSWFELLNSPISAEQMRALLKKEIHLGAPARK